MRLFLDTPRVICYILPVRCKICQKEFIPSKYRPQQQVCPSEACQRIRQTQNERDWRIKNPDYFKHLGQEASFQRAHRRYNQLWKANHKVHLTAYGSKHKAQHREYMREYMRRYRRIRAEKIKEEEALS